MSPRPWYCVCEGAAWKWDDMPEERATSSFLDWGCYELWVKYLNLVLPKLTGSIHRIWNTGLSACSSSLVPTYPLFALAASGMLLVEGNPNIFRSRVQLRKWSDLDSFEKDWRETESFAYTCTRNSLLRRHSFPLELSRPCLHFLISRFQSLHEKSAVMTTLTGKSITQNGLGLTSTRQNSLLIMAVPNLSQDLQIPKTQFQTTLPSKCWRLLLHVEPMSGMAQISYVHCSSSSCIQRSLWNSIFNPLEVAHTSLNYVYWLVDSMAPKRLIPCISWIATSLNTPKIPIKSCFASKAD